jgi:hypothetical protein
MNVGQFTASALLAHAQLRKGQAPALKCSLIILSAFA